MAGMLAMALDCSGYNNNFVSRSLAFETSLMDAFLLFREKETKMILLEAFDETSPQQYGEFIRLGYLKKEKTDHLFLCESQTEGTLHGEGAASFLLSADPSRALCRLKALHMIPHPCGSQTLADELMTFLAAHKMQIKDIDVTVSGISGDMVRDTSCRHLEKTCLDATTLVRFKHLTGDYATASSFALWLGTMIIRHQYIPPVLITSFPKKVPPSIETVLIVNHFLGKSYSFILLTKD
jgi:3-oxoacyl-(acyl-carrier-protein) synthase